MIHLYRAAVFAAAIVVTCGFAGPAQAARFMGLGDLAGGLFNSSAQNVSADGSVVVGQSYSATGAEAFRWTSGGGMVSLGDLTGGGFGSSAQGISADGSVIVGQGSSASGTEAYRWTSASGMVGLSDLSGGGFTSGASGISANETVVGFGSSASGSEAFRWTSRGGMVGLSDLAGGGFSSSASGISADGSVIVGQGTSASGREAFRWTSAGGMVGLGDLTGGGFASFATAVSADGSVVVGQGTSASGIEAFRWTSGEGMVSLGNTPDGGFGFQANGVSADGSTIVGYGSGTEGTDAFVWDATNGLQRIRDVLSPSVGAALTGWTLTGASAVSADGRTVVGYGTDPNGQQQAWVAYLPSTIYWSPQSSSAWDSASSWMGPFSPGPSDDVVIDPTTAVTVTGPATSKTVSTLSIGGSGVGRVTLRLAGTTNGDLQATSYAYFQPNAELSLADGRIFSAPALYNYGLIHGTGTVNTNLLNYVGGEVRVATGESLIVSGGGHSNDGKFEAIGGSLEFIGNVANNVDTGLITGRSATFRFQGGLANAGSLSLTGGTNDVSGDIDNTGSIVVSGGAGVTFYDDIVQNGTLRVSKVGGTTSVAVFLGDVSGSGGSTGDGDIFFEGDLRPGNSPASVTFGNNVSFGSAARLDIELDGTQYDQVHINGQLALDGALAVSLVNGFTPQAGSSFSILDWTSLRGTFSSLSLPLLAEGLAWNNSQLYTTGVLSVVSTGIPGDYNSNGIVDAADYVVWRKGLGTTYTQNDYDVWRANFGRSAGSGAGAVSLRAAVPEPFSLGLLFAFSIIGLIVRVRVF